MITIAVDAMGGDNAPRPEVEGSVLAARELGVRVMLVGQPQVIKPELAKHDRSGLKIEIVAGQRSDHDGRSPGAGVSAEERQFGARGGAAGA